jgi:hypothetical protein
MTIRILALLSLFVAIPWICNAKPQAAEKDKANPAALIKALTLYASFDDAVQADFGKGDKSLWTRSNDATPKGKFVFEKGFDSKVYRIAKGKGISGAALECTDVLPRGGRMYFPAKGNIAFKKGGWSAAVSVWINTDPNMLLKTRFCDPVQITQKGALNGGIWFDFNDAKPRDMRHGLFTSLTAGEKGISEDDPAAPMVRVPKVPFKSGDWHHIVLSWKNLDTGKKDALSVFYIDGKRIGAIEDRALSMDWDMDKTGIYLALSYIGLLDELALFDRALSAEEVALLHARPGLLGERK